MMVSSQAMRDEKIAHDSLSSLSWTAENRVADATFLLEARRYPVEGR